VSREQDAGASLGLPSPAFAETARVKYDFAQAVHGDIPQEALVPVSRLDEFAGYAGSLALLEPYYDKMERNGWEPAVEFYLEGLSLPQADHLLSGHQLGDGLESSGVICKWSNYWHQYQGLKRRPKREDEEGFPQEFEPKPAIWDVGVISDADKPFLRHISADGSFGGPRAQSAIEALQDLFGSSGDQLDSKGRETLVAMASPSIGAYNMLQLRRLKQGRQPVDYPEGGQKIVSFLSHKILLAMGNRSIVGYWHGKQQGVGISHITTFPNSRYMGVRPSVLASDLMPKQT
jgi:hypothetical protein